MPQTVPRGRSHGPCTEGRHPRLWKALAKEPGHAREPAARWPPLKRALDASRRRRRRPVWRLQHLARACTPVPTRRTRPIIAPRSASAESTRRPLPAESGCMGPDEPSRQTDAPCGRRGVRSDRSPRRRRAKRSTHRGVSRPPLACDDPLVSGVRTPNSTPPPSDGFQRQAPRSRSRRRSGTLSSIMDKPTTTDTPFSTRASPRPMARAGIWCHPQASRGHVGSDRSHEHRSIERVRASGRRVRTAACAWIVDSTGSPAAPPRAKRSRLRIGRRDAPTVCRSTGVIGRIEACAAYASSDRIPADPRPAHEHARPKDEAPLAAAAGSRGAMLAEGMGAPSAEGRCSTSCMTPLERTRATVGVGASGAKGDARQVLGQDASRIAAQRLEVLGCP